VDFRVQRYLPGGPARATYLGNRVTHLSVTQQLNNTPAQYLSVAVSHQNTFLAQQIPAVQRVGSCSAHSISRAALRQPYRIQQYLDLTAGGLFWYHSLRVRLEKRLSRATVQMSYTHSKYMQATEFLNPTDPLPYRVISDMDRPNLFTISGLWEIPVGRGRRFGSNLARPVNAVIGGWQFDASEIHQSGAPLSWGNIIFTGNIKDVQLPAGQQTVDRWFNIYAGFNKNSAQQLANNIRTFPLRFSGIRGDGQTIWNFSLLRNYSIGEHLKMQFRAEAYNAFNHPVFDLPSTSVTSSAFGTVTSSISEPRGFQFALKIVF
jgi:hypothetical protein